MPTPRQTTADPLNDPPSRPGTNLPAEDAAAVATRMAEWRDAFRPTSPEESWLYEQVVVNSVRVNACQRLETELRTQLALRASVSWDEDRRLAAEKTAASLSRSPARVARALRQTKQGCEWLLDRWHFLAAALANAGTWTKSQHTLALNLLGTPPEFRDEPLQQSPSETVAAEIARLERLKADSLDELDGHERAAAEIGLETQPGEALARLRRYEAACLRRYQWARAVARPSGFHVAGRGTLM